MSRDFSGQNVRKFREISGNPGKFQTCPGNPGVYQQSFEKSRDFPSISPNRDSSGLCSDFPNFPKKQCKRQGCLLFSNNLASCTILPRPLRQMRPGQPRRGRREGRGRERDRGPRVPLAGQNGLCTIWQIVHARLQVFLWYHLSCGGTVVNR